MARTKASERNNLKSAMNPSMPSSPIEPSESEPWSEPGFQEASEFLEMNAVEMTETPAHTVPPGIALPDPDDDVFRLDRFPDTTDTDVDLERHESAESMEPVTVELVQIVLQEPVESTTEGSPMQGPVTPVNPVTPGSSKIQQEETPFYDAGLPYDGRLRQRPAPKQSEQSQTVKKRTKVSKDSSEEPFDPTPKKRRLGVSTVAPPMTPESPSKPETRSTTKPKKLTKVKPAKKAAKKDSTQTKKAKVSEPVHVTRSMDRPSQEPIHATRSLDKENPVHATRSLDKEIRQEPVHATRSIDKEIRQEPAHATRSIDKNAHAQEPVHATRSTDIHDYEPIHATRSTDIHDYEPIHATRSKDKHNEIPTVKKSPKKTKKAQVNINRDIAGVSTRSSPRLLASKA